MILNVFPLVRYNCHHDSDSDFERCLIHFLLIVVMLVTMVIKASVKYLSDICRGYNRDYNYVCYLFCSRDHDVMRSVIVVIVFLVIVIIVTLCMSAIFNVILDYTLIAVICNDMYVFLFFWFVFQPVVYL